MSGGEGGIVTLASPLSYHFFSNMHENRMNTADFYDFARFNCLSYFHLFGSNFGHKQTPKTPRDFFAPYASTECSLTTSCRSLSSRNPTNRVCLRRSAVEGGVLPSIAILAHPGALTVYASRNPAGI